MSKTKQALPENVDVTDPRDTFSTPDSGEPEPQDWAMAELSGALSILEEKGATGYIVELKEARVRIQKIIEQTLKPF